MFSQLFSKKKSYPPLLSEEEIKELIYEPGKKNKNHSKQVLDQGRTGMQLSSQIGSGNDFADLRPYFHGDDIRHINWRATARSQVPLLKTFHSEFSQPLCLLIDRRASMRFATRKRLKLTQALRMALFIGGQEARSGREISAVLLDEHSHWLAPQEGYLALELIARLGNQTSPTDDEHCENEHAINWQTIFTGLQQHLSQGSELVLISDFAGLTDTDNKMLARLSKHCSINAIHIMDSSEDYDSDSFFLNERITASRKLQWQDRSQTLALQNDHSAMLFKQALKNRYDKLVKRFQRANIHFSSLSVELDALDKFLFEKT